MIKVSVKPLGTKEFQDLKTYESPENAAHEFNKLLTYGFQVIKADHHLVSLELDGSAMKFESDKQEEMTEMVAMALLWQDAYERVTEIILDRVDKELVHLPQKKDLGLFNITFARVQAKVAVMITQKISKPKEIEMGVKLKKVDLLAALKIREETSCTFEAALQLAK
mgnify:CR=1 FL=1